MKTQIGGSRIVGALAALLVISVAGLQKILTAKLKILLSRIVDARALQQVCMYLLCSSFIRLTRIRSVSLLITVAGVDWSRQPSVFLVFDLSHTRLLSLASVGQGSLQLIRLSHD
ncbi:hypothetical protein ACLOJK_026418 [Asimina triloba]